MNYGVKNCIWTALGDVTANLFQATLVIFVIGTFLSDNPNFLNFFKWIGVVYLLYLSYIGNHQNLTLIHQKLSILIKTLQHWMLDCIM